MKIPKMKMYTNLNFGRYIGTFWCVQHFLLFARYDLIFVGVSVCRLMNQLIICALSYLDAFLLLGRIFAFSWTLHDFNTTNISFPLCAAWFVPTGWILTGTCRQYVTQTGKWKRKGAFSLISKTFNTQSMF